MSRLLTDLYTYTQCMAPMTGSWLFCFADAFVVVGWIAPNMSLLTVASRVFCRYLLDLLDHDSYTIAML